MITPSRIRESLSSFLDYPYEVVIFDRRVAREILFPSVTICPENWFDRGREQCERDPRFCTVEGQMLTIGFYHFQGNATIRKLVRFEARDLFKCRMVSKICPSFDCVDFMKPTYFRQPRHQCYTMDLLQFLPTRHFYRKCEHAWSYRLELSSEWSDRTLSLASDFMDAGLFVQGPGLAMPAKQTVVDLPTGRDLRIGVRQIATERLKRPFSSKCRQYADMDDKYFGLESREYCIQKCVIAAEMDICNCVLILHEYAETIARQLPMCNAILAVRCFRSIAATDRIQKCVENCDVNCLDISYDVKVWSLRDLPPTPSDSNGTSLSPPKAYKLKLEFYSDRTEVSKEQRMTSPVELLGFLGGYVGMWIGVSLLETVGSLQERLSKQTIMGSR
ncbi:uncharacterized protein LOC114828463 [Galendromus occidentalis]|uniref:Uncharacterized protein LOC114828463 n=1 Tax=Galendromus occidentalis TaxID=34638 RepID=A0AAJ7WIU2_9ACAR|nr:uncharacterized protein LOC114828463 [Galendromus occidentalis]